MKHRNLILFISIVFLLLPSTGMLAQAYKPGDTIHVVYSPHVNVGMKPKFVRYTLFDPDNNVVYEEDHGLAYVRLLPPGIFWEWSDEYDIRVQAFSAPGTWRVEGRLFSEALWIIELPDLFPLRQEFEVEEVSFFENLLAPCYFTYDGGVLMGRVSGVFPVHPLLIIIVVGVLIFVLLFVKLFIDMIVSHGGKKV